MIRNWYKENNVKEKPASPAEFSESGGITIQVRAVKPTHFSAQTIEKDKSFLKDLQQIVDNYVAKIIATHN